VSDRVRAVRQRIRNTRTGRIVWQAAVAVLGGAIIIAGVVLLPLPGPGWLIIFAGLGVLATEFASASRLLRYARGKLTAWTDWIATRGRGVQALIGAASLAVLAAVVVGAFWIYRR
jgi:uncharacterized protein (TIGR02611 family)